MTTRTATRLAWALWLLTLALVIVGRAFDWLNRGAESLALGAVVYNAILPMAFVTVGAMIVLRRPANLIGSIFAAIGVDLGLLASVGHYATYALVTAPGTLPAGVWMALLAGALWAPSFFPLVTIVPLLFPHGRLPSPRWRPVAWLAGAGIVLIVVGNLLLPEAVKSFADIDNPLAIEGAGNIITLVGSLMVLASMFASLVSLIWCFRASQGVERQQFKWFVYPAILVGITLLGGIFLDERGQALTLLFAVPCLPVAVGIAILRYRLYDIDIIIRRTLVYTLLSTVLALIYIGAVVVLQRLLAPLVGESNQLAVVASTLAIVALFQPLRRRIRSIIDRRFYRRKYDTAKTLQAFNARVRDQVELSTLTDDVLDVVQDTLQPAHVSLWLRPTPRQ